MMVAGIITPVRAPSMLPSFKRPTLPSVIESSNQSLSTISSPTTPTKTTTNTTSSQLEKPKNLAIQLDAIKLCKRDERYSATFFQQFLLLSQRTFLILSRHRSLTYMRISIHCMVSVFIGIMYFQIGNEAHHIFDNFRYIFFSIMFLMFTAYSSMTMACKFICDVPFGKELINSDFKYISVPLELPIVIREHFNRWYSLKAYYTATTLADFPIQFVCTLIYITTTYFMTKQPPDFFRFWYFFGICLMVSMVAQSLGLLTGSLFSVKVRKVYIF